MADPPLTIATLIHNLEVAIKRLGEATSFKQRKARNQVVINRGLALYDRLVELGAWLTRDGDGTDSETYFSHLKKYEDGWNALNAAEQFIQEYRRLHWEEITNDHVRPRPRPKSGHHARKAPQEGGDKPPATTNGGPVLRDTAPCTQRPLLW